MLRLKKRGGQSTAEYAILIGVVISAVIGMQVIIGERLKARIDRALTYQDPAVAADSVLNYIFSGDRQAPPTNIDVDVETERFSPIRQTFRGENIPEGRGKQRRDILETGYGTDEGEIIQRTGNQKITFTP